MPRLCRCLACSLSVPDHFNAETSSALSASCIGRHFAEMEAIMAFATLLQKYTFTPSPNFQWQSVHRHTGADFERDSTLRSTLSQEGVRADGNAQG